MIKLSIIIPMYGVEKYIEKCLMSCINQQGVELGKDYEIICVNDGTKDKSAEIAKCIASQYQNVTVIDQENQGLSAARNNGTALAKGEYIWYVDSDDYVEVDALSHILPMLKNELDILQIQYRLVYEDGRKSKDIHNPAPLGVFSGHEVTEQGGLEPPAQFSVLRSKYLKEYSFHFVKGIYHEDAEFKPRVTYLANKIAFLDYICYNYLQREGTIMSTYRPKKMYDSMLIVDNLFAFMDKYVAKEHYKVWGRAFSGVLSNVLYLANYSKDPKMMDDAKAFVDERPRCMFAMTCSPSLFLRIVGYISRLCGGNLFAIYKILYKIKY